jgi:hypothetical protein
MEDGCFNLRLCRVCTKANVSPVRQYQLNLHTGTVHRTALQPASVTSINLLSPQVETNE